MLGIRRPTAGTVRLFGRPPTDLGARSRCGVMLQESGVPDLLTVGDLVRLFSSYYPRHLPASDVIRKAGLEAKAQSRFGSLSGGQRQRLFYALAICGDPEVLFLDEPTVGLDVEGRRAFLEELKGWAGGGRTLILTTHYLEEADQLARRIVVIDHGRVIADAAPAAIKGQVAGKRISVRFRGDPPRAALEALPVTSLALDGDTATMLSSDPVRAVRQLMLTTGDDVIDLDVTGADLEEAFVQLTSRRDAAHV
jgi:ABC-2 type transport system ATP-binding protein